VYVDVEAITRQYLIDTGIDVPVGTQVPDPRPARFIRLRIAGNRQLTIAHRDTSVAIECWCDAEDQAAQLAEQVYSLLDVWDLVPDWDGWPSPPYPQPDPTTGTPRYVMVCTVRTRTEEES